MDTGAATRDTDVVPGAAAELIHVVLMYPALRIATHVERATVLLGDKADLHPSTAYCFGEVRPAVHDQAEGNPVRGPKGAEYRAAKGTTAPSLVGPCPRRDGPCWGAKGAQIGAHCEARQCWGRGIPMRPWLSTKGLPEAYGPQH